jgi:hypothetical protein
MPGRPRGTRPAAFADVLTGSPVIAGGSLGRFPGVTPFTVDLLSGNIAVTPRGWESLVGDAEREAGRGEAGMAMRLVPQASAGAVMPPEAVELQASSGAAGERTALAGTLHAGWSPTPTVISARAL